MLIWRKWVGDEAVPRVEHRWRREGRPGRGAVARGGAGWGEAGAWGGGARGRRVAGRWSTGRRRAGSRRAQRRAIRAGATVHNAPNLPRRRRFGHMSMPTMLMGPLPDRGRCRTGGRGFVASCRAARGVAVARGTRWRGTKRGGHGPTATSGRRRGLRVHCARQPIAVAAQVTAAPRHIRGDPRAGSVRAERPCTGHHCRVLS